MTATLLAAGAVCLSLLGCSSEETEEAAPGEPELVEPLPVYAGEIWCAFRPNSENLDGNCSETRSDCEHPGGARDIEGLDNLEELDEACRSVATGWAWTTETDIAGTPFIHTQLFPTLARCEGYQEFDARGGGLGTPRERSRVSECYRVENPNHQETPLTPEQAFWMAVRHGGDPMDIESEEAPVEIESSGVVRRYNHNRLEARFRNTDERTIDGIRFGVFCYDNFNEPAINRHSPGREPTNYTAVRSQETVQPGALSSRRSYWNLFGSDSCTKSIVVVTEVHFTNNETWEGYFIQDTDPREVAAPE